MEAQTNRKAKSLMSRVNMADKQSRSEVSAANELYYDGKYAEAAKAYKAILEKYAEFSYKDQVRTRLGRCYERLNNDALALQMYQDVITDDPNGSYVSQAVSMMGNLYVQRYQYKKAISALQQITAKYPQTKAAEMAGYLIPMYLDAQGMMAEAIEGYKRFLNDFPQSSYRMSAFSRLTSLYLKGNRFDEAERMLTENMGKSPGDVELMQKLAGVYQKKGKYEEALKLYQAALAKNPNNTSLIEKLGEFYLESGDKEKAIAEWSKLTQNTSDEYYQYQRLGNILKEHGFYREAVQQYEVAIKLQPRVSYLYSQLADVYKIQGRMDDAIATYLRALLELGVGYTGRDNIISDMAELYSGELKNQLFQKAIAKLQAELAKRPKDADIILSLAEINFHQGDFESSLKQFIRLASLYNDQGRWLNKYAQILERDDNLEAALAFYTAISKYFPNSRYDLQSKLKSGELYYQLGKWDKALTVLQELIRQDKSRQFTTDAYLLMGEIQLRGQRDVKAAEATYATVERLPYSVAKTLDIKLRRAECSILLGNYSDAETILNPITSKPGGYGIEARELLGDSYFYQGKFNEAVEEYQKVVNHSSDALSLEAMITLRGRSPYEGITWNNDAMTMINLIKGNYDYFQQPLAIYAEASRLELSGNYQAALDAYNDILQQFDNCMLKDDTILAIGNLHLRQKQFREALTSFERLAQLESPLSAEGQMKIGDVYQELHEPSQAIAAYSDLIQKYSDTVLTTYARNQIRTISEKKSID
ncbi:MAG: tetratricopeptide repeat protein [Candidatus Poribacteria bacterium]